MVNMIIESCDFDIDNFNDNVICLTKEVHNLTKTYDHYDSANNFFVREINAGNNPTNAEKCANLKAAVNKIRIELNNSQSSHIKPNSRNPAKNTYNFENL